MSCMKLVVLCSFLYDQFVVGVRPEDCVREEVLGLSSEFTPDLHVKRQMLGLRTELFALEEAVEALREKYEGVVSEYVSLKQ